LPCPSLRYALGAALGAHPALPYLRPKMMVSRFPVPVPSTPKELREPPSVGPSVCSTTCSVVHTLHVALEEQFASTSDMVRHALAGIRSCRTVIGSLSPARRA